MKILKYTYLLFLGLLLSCNDTNNDNENLDFGTIRDAKGYYQEGDKKFKLYSGGDFRLNETGNLKNLFPPSINHAISSRLALQIYQGLVKLNQRTLNVENLLAKSIDMTFKMMHVLSLEKEECLRQMTLNFVMI